jgi:hypothetical protein
MSRRSIAMKLLRLVAATAACASPAAAADYRGMSAGWPNFANGAYAANYPQNGGGPAYYVARPAIPAYAAARPAGTAFVPVRAAYANPTYYAAYNAAPAGYRAAPASYAPSAAYYAPQPAAAYYAPANANYAPAQSYAVTPAGIAAAGSEAATYYGQPNAVNYVPPRFSYRPTYAAVPVYMYRPVTAYNPVTAQYSTCQQATVATTCQPQRTSCFSWCNPFTWFRHGSCGSGGCAPAAVPTTAYCGTGCPQPYYPAAPTVIPAVPAPVNVLPQGTVIPTYPAAPPAGPVIPSPPTRFQTVPGAVPQGTISPGIVPRAGAADVRPSLAPPPGSTIIGPSTPGTTIPPGSFQTTPGVPPPGFTPTAPGAFGSGTNYPPASDPYSSNLTPALTPPANNGALNGTINSKPNHSVLGSGYNGNVIRAPELGPALPPNVQTVPDLDATEQPRPINRAPQLVDPRDKTAMLRRDQRWAVVPAKWPTVAPKTVASQVAPVEHRAATHLTGTTQTAPVYDDGGWKSAR